MPCWQPLLATLTVLTATSACVATGGGATGSTAGSGAASGGPAPLFAADVSAVTDSTSADTADSGPFTTKADLGSNPDSVADAEQPPVTDATDSGPTDAVILDAADGKADGKADAKADVKTDAKDSTADTAPAACGDGQCQSPEACGDCPQDCGPCTPSCGDGSCGGDESCETCPSDCPCAAKCGDKTCDKASENCDTCPDDCGKCPTVCGNGTCEIGESCTSCAKDCPCAPKCGDKSCDKATEDCQKCPADCGTCPGQCNPITHSGCPSGQQCYPVTTGPPVCSSPGTLTKGKLCNALADCALGLLCISGVCGSVCDSTGATAGYTCTAPSACSQLQSNGVPIGFNLGVCLGGAICHLVTNSGCGTAMACITFGSGKACIKPGSGASGATCQGSDDCIASYVCVTDAGNKKTCVLKCNAATLIPKCSSGACQTLSSGNPPKSAPDDLGGCL